MGRESLHGPRGRQTAKESKLRKAHCRKMWPLDDNMPAGRGSGAGMFFKEAMQLPYHTWQWRIIQTSQKCKVHFKTSTSRLWSHVADKLKEANAQAPAVAVYLLWTTFSKGHLTEPVPSGGLWLRRAGGHLPDPTAGGVGGGKGGGGQGGDGGGSWGGRTSREKGTAPLAIRAVLGALKELWGAISIRKQGPVDS